MNKKTQAFTLLEVTIALALSCVVVFGMLQAYRNLMTYLEKVREILGANRKVCLLFNQMERDFNTAFIPPYYEDAAKDDGAQLDQDKPDANKPKVDDAQPQSKEEQEKHKKKKLEKLKTYFVASADEQEIRRFEGRSIRPFKHVAMINTNPLQVYGQRRVRLVRVQYELTVDKEKSKGDRQCYKLWRKETTDIDNVKMKVNEFSAPTEREKIHPLREHLVADNIKTLYIEYIFKETKKEKDKDTADRGGNKEKGEPEEKRFFTWGDRKETMGVVPCRVELFIEFWDNELRQSQSSRALFIIFSYPTVHEEKDKKKDVSGKMTDKDKQAVASSTADQQPPAVTSPATPPGVPLPTP